MQHEIDLKNFNIHTDLIIEDPNHKVKYNVEEKKYYSNHFEGQFEIVSLTGTINTMNGEFYTHIHLFHHLYNQIVLQFR